jgi:hypothetical protein
VKKLVVVGLLAGIAMVFAFEPRARDAVVRLYQNTVVEWTTPDPAGDVPYDQQKVYLPRNSEFYHRKDCPMMTEVGVPTKLVKARELAKPCPHCKPPE